MQQTHIDLHISFAPGPSALGLHPVLYVVRPTEHLRKVENVVPLLCIL